MQTLRAGTSRIARTVAARRQRTLAGTVLAFAGALTLPSAAAADARELSLPEVVVDTTPLPGTAVVVDALPGEVRSLELAGDAAARSQPATEALAGRFAGIGLEDALGDAFQLTLAYRGFAASPQLGTPQGLAVYQDGVRLNEGFGDVVNWDLVPGFAIRRIDVAGASPAYGANALGGAVVFTMKNGLTDRGLAADFEGGSFGAHAATLEYGGHDGQLAWYVGGRALGEDGARRFSANSLRQLYADLRYVSTRDTLALSVASGDDRLNGPGAAPLQELAVSRSLTFTGPQQADNRQSLVTLHGESRLGRSLTVTGVAYYRDFRQALVNGNTTGYRACTTAAAAGQLCQADGATPLTGLDGTPIADPAAGSSRPLGENDVESVTTHSSGGSMQLAGHATLLGLRHALALGAAVDSARVRFTATAAVGIVDPQLQVTAAGPVIGTVEGTAFAATPVELGVRSRTRAWHASDAVTLARGLTATASAQYAVEDLSLDDGRGTALSGASRFQRLNPALGLNFRTAGGPTVYAGYAETSRAPSASEIECSDPARPCLLPSTLAGDPPRLRQVIARTWEAGLRQAGGSAGSAGLGFSAGVFRADLTDEIYGVATGAGTGYYANIGATRRQGLSADVSYRGAAWSGYASGALVDATFRDALLIPSPQNPFADANGDIAVRAGAHMPGIARLRATLGAEWRAAKMLRVGATLIAVGASYYHGDESNQNARLPGYARLDLHSALALGTQVELALALVNVLDAHYATTGLYADPTGVGAPGVPAADASDPAVDRRFVTPAQPWSWRLTLRVRM